MPIITLTATFTADNWSGPDHVVCKVTFPDHAEYQHFSTAALTAAVRKLSRDIWGPSADVMRQSPGLYTVIYVNDSKNVPQFPGRNPALGSQRWTVQNTLKLSTQRP